MHRIHENFSPSKGARRRMNGSKPSAIVIGGGPAVSLRRCCWLPEASKSTYLRSNRGWAGRTACIEESGYKFDIGPTFLMMKPLLDRIFEEAGEKSPPTTWISSGWIRCTKSDSATRPSGPATTTPTLALKSNDSSQVRARVLTASSIVSANASTSSFRFFEMDFSSVLGSLRPRDASSAAASLDRLDRFR